MNQKRIKYVTVLHMVLWLILSACASTPPPVPIPSMPYEWGLRIDINQAKCKPVSGVFENLGVRHAENGVETLDGLLSKNVLSRNLPTRQNAESVAIYSDTESNVLTAQLRGQVVRKIAIEVSCDSGWHVFTYERTGNYMGDGVEEKRFRHRTWLRQDRDGNLVARVLEDAVYEARFSELTTKRSENWYRFEPTN